MYIAMAIVGVVCILFAGGVMFSSEHDDSIISLGVVAFMLGLACVGFPTYRLVVFSGKALAHNDIEQEVVQEILGTFKLDQKRSYVVLRRWGSDDTPTMYELKNPLPADTSCALFREQLDAEPVSCPVKKAEH